METNNTVLTEELNQVVEATEGTSTVGKVIVGVLAGIGAVCTLAGAVFGAKKGYKAIQEKKACAADEESSEEE